jgi:serine protease AprX
MQTPGLAAGRAPVTGRLAGKLAKLTPALASAILFSFAASAVAGTHAPQLDELFRKNPTESVDVIITYKDAQVAPILGGESRKLASLRGGELRRTTVADAIRLSGLATVAHVTVNHPIMATGTAVYDFMPQAIMPTSQPMFAPLNTLGFLYGYGGNGPVGVALIDSGIHIDPSNPDLNYGATVVYSQSFVASEGTDDLYGHGTHLAGIIAGTGQNSLSGYSNSIFGVAPGVQLINLKVLDKNGNSTDATVIQAINQAIALKNQYNIKVINLSLGRPIYESFLKDPLCQAVEQAWMAGITVVVAAGNSGRMYQAGTQGYGTIASPGNDPLAITVGAMNTESSLTTADDQMTTYSSKGPSLSDKVIKPDLVAPGNRIFSILAPGTTLAANANATIVGSYLVLSGTSMSAAVTSGAAATLISLESLTPDQVKARLMKTATKLPNVSYSVYAPDNKVT